MSAHLIPCLKMRKWRQEDEDLSQVTELVQDAARKNACQNIRAGICCLPKLNLLCRLWPPCPANSPKEAPGAWVWVLALQLTCCVTSAKYLAFSGPQEPLCTRGPSLTFKQSEHSLGLGPVAPLFFFFFTLYKCRFIFLPFNNSMKTVVSC